MAACGFTLGDSENTASAYCNTHIAEVNRTLTRALTINVPKDAVSAKGDVRSSTH